MTIAAEYATLIYHFFCFLTSTSYIFNPQFDRNTFVIVGMHYNKYTLTSYFSKQGQQISLSSNDRSFPIVTLYFK